MTSDAPSHAALPADTELKHGLADDLRRLEQKANGMPISLGEVVATLEDRGHAVAILLLAAPFVIIPIPGLSTIVGMAVLMLSLGVLLNTKPWLPQFISRRQISPEGMHRLVGGTTRVLARVERFVKPRMQWLTGKAWHWVIGLSLVMATLALMLPIPIPGNNIPPAIGILLLALGLLERDGLFVLVGHLYTLVMWVILIVVAVLFWEAVNGYVHKVIDRVSQLFG